MIGGAFVLMTLVLPLLGAWTRISPRTRELPWPGQAAVFFAGGLVAVGVEMLILSAAGIRWSLPLLATLPLAAGAWTFRRTEQEHRTRWRPRAVLLVALLGVIVLASAFLSAAATSGDYVFFWGTKGQRFGAARILDVSFLRDPHFGMGHPDYPPLLPFYYAWTMLGGGDFDWFGGLASGPLLLLLAGSAVTGFGRYAGIRQADGIAALLMTMMALLYIRNDAGGNAEPMLMFFEVVALSALCCWRRVAGEHDLVASVALAGAALTKVEGGVFAVTVIGVTWLARRGGLKERSWHALRVGLLPLAAIVAWRSFCAVHDLNEVYIPLKEGLSLRYFVGATLQLLKEMSLFSWYGPWIAALLMTAGGRIRAALPYAAGAGVILLFLNVLYSFESLPNPASGPAGVRYGQAVFISWSAPRVLPAAVLFLLFGALAAQRARNAEADLAVSDA